LILKDRKHLLVWLILPFLIVHSIIPHKEPRFLFPLVNVIPLLLIIGYQLLKKYFLPIDNSAFRLSAKIFYYVFFIMNVFALAAVCVRPADGRVAIYKYVSEKYKTQPVRIVYSKWADYFTPQVPANFYKQQNVELVQLNSLSEFNKKYIDTTKLNFIVLRRGQDVIQNISAGNILERSGYKKEMQSLPVWIEKLGVPTKMVFENEILELYRKQ
jgi:phosphatidylinositol glycan class B